MSLFAVYNGIETVFQLWLPMALSLFALVGFFLVLRTRPDAFDAADRKSKGVWAGLLFGSAIFLFFPVIGWLLLGIPIIAGLVITGIYWMDVRPQIRDILDNAQGSW